jgi:Protein of unknown function (DUF2783)
MALTEQQLDDVYTDLCYRLTEVGEAATPQAMARLILLLMHEVDDAARLQAAIDAALEGFARPVRIERPA